VADPVAPAAPASPTTPAPEAPALDALPLGEFVRQRNDGAKPPVPPPVGDGDAGETEDGEADGGAADPLTASPAAKASRTRGELQKRIDTLVRKAADAERLHGASSQRVQALEQELATLRNGHGHARPPEPAAPPRAADGAPHTPPLADPAPELDQYLQEGKSYEQWVRESARWESRQEIAAAFAAEQQRRQAEAAQQAFQQQVNGFPERAAAVRATHPDFDHVVQNDSVVLSPVMQDVCLRSPQGAEIMYWLGTHPEAANEIAQLSQAYPPQAFPLIERHLLALAGSAGTPAPTGTGPATTPVTRAPAPISPVGGGGTQTSRSLDEVPLSEFIQRRNAEVARRRGGGR
jgi:hypothetical protein